MKNWLGNLQTLVKSSSSSNHGDASKKKRTLSINLNCWGEERQRNNLKLKKPLQI